MVRRVMLTSSLFRHRRTLALPGDPANYITSELPDASGKFAGFNRLKESRFGTQGK